MKSCCICKKNQKPGNGSFFRVPDDGRRLKWSKICNMDFSRNAIVCSDHFASSNILRLEKCCTLLPKAVPIMPANNEISLTSPNPMGQPLLINQSPLISDATVMPVNSSTVEFSSMDQPLLVNNPVSFPEEYVMDQPPLIHNETEMFSEKETQTERQKWIDFFGIKYNDSKYWNACGRHFSNTQKCGSKLKPDAVPDLHKNTDDFLVPTISSLSYSMYTQTNTRLCGSVEISEFLDEYRLSCYYCSSTFPMENYVDFTDHLKVKHFESEQAFKAKNYPYDDHDYTTEYSGSPLPDPVVYNAVKDKEPLEIPYILPLSEPLPRAEPGEFELINQDKPLNVEEAAKLIKLLDETLLNPNYVYTEKDPLALDNKDDIQTTSTTTSLTSPVNSNINTSKNNLATTSTASSSFPANSNGTCLDKTAINSRTNLSPTSVVTIRSTPMRVKTFINNTTGTTKVVPLSTPSSVSQDSKNMASSTKAKQIISDKEGRLFSEKLDQPSAQNVKQFETLYLRKPSEEVTSGLFYIKDIESNTITRKQNFEKSALKRCLKRASYETNDEYLYRTLKLYVTELVFQFTPRDIIMDLLDNIKDHPTLWTFHKEPYNEDYSTSIDELCNKMNKKWSLKLSPLQMRRSINRILTYYRYMLPCDKVDIYNEYFVKCAEFLPTLENDIPPKRCVFCDICFANASEMRKHLVEKHEYLKLPYKCDHCSERFKEKEECELHKILPHYMEIFRCQHCNKAFNQRYILKRHLSVHEPPAVAPPPKLHECSVCGKAFRTNSELSGHKTYHGEKLFKCHLCEKSYYQKIYLEQHVKSHFNERNFICEVCGKAFLDNQRLKAHSDIHTDRKVTCNICGLKLRKVSLPRHLRLCHVACEGTIESTFRAKAYNYKRYAQQQQNKRSGARYTSTPQSKRSKIIRQYGCKKCNIHFDRLKFLKDHNEEVHFNVEWVECVICNIQVRHKPSLKRHYRDKHKLHPIQIFKLIDEKQDLETVLSLKIDDLPQEEIENNTNLFRFTRADVVNNTNDAADSIEDVDYIDDDDVVDSIEDLYKVTEP